MTRAIGPRSVTSGSELQARPEQAIPVQFSPLGGGDWDEDQATRARRRRLRWQIGGGAALVLAIASFGIVIASSVYEARSSVLIRPPNGNGSVPQAVDGALQSEVEILQSFEVLRQALESIGIEVLYPGVDGETVGEARAAAVARMREALAVRTLPGSDVIEVTFRHDEAQLAADVVNRLVERFQRSRRQTLAPATSESFLQERIEQQREALAAAEAAQAAFHAEHPALAASEPRSALAERRATLEAEQRSLRDAFDAERTSGSSEDPSVARARARLDELELELQGTLNTHVEGSRAVSKVRHEISLVREYLATKERSATLEMARRLDVLRARQGELEAQLTALGEAERHLPELENQSRELARARDGAARRLDAYQRELEAATLAADVGEHKVAVAVRVLESAHAPTARMIPEERARQAWALVGVALLVLLGAFLMDVLEQRRTRRQPMLWTAHVGAGGEAGSVALLMGNQQRGQSGGPVVLLLSGAGGNDAGRVAGAGAGSDGRE
jgi:uncharacterized protein involved in exopolysaccharide biosynthesis